MTVIHWYFNCFPQSLIAIALLFFAVGCGIGAMLL